MHAGKKEMKKAQRTRINPRGPALDSRCPTLDRWENNPYCPIRLFSYEKEWADFHGIEGSTRVTNFLLLFNKSYFNYSPGDLTI
jgi:hypothetical protein